MCIRMRQGYRGLSVFYRPFAIPRDGKRSCVAGYACGAVGKCDIVSCEEGLGGTHRGAEWVLGSSPLATLSRSGGGIVLGAVTPNGRSLPPLQAMTQPLQSIQRSV